MTRIRNPISASGVVVAVVLVGGLWGLAGYREREQQERAHQEVEAQALQLGAQLNGDALAVSNRVASLAELPMIRSAIATDASTVEELASRESVLAPVDREVLELYQLPKAGGRVPLLRVPATEPAATGSATGLSLSLQGAVAIVTARRPVESMYRQQELTGELAVSRRTSLKPLADHFRSSGLAAALREGDSSIPLTGGGGDWRRAIASSVPLAPAFNSESLVLSVLPERSWLRAAAIGASIGAVMSLTIALFAALRRRRQRARLEPPKAAATREELSSTALRPASNVLSPQWETQSAAEARGAPAELVAGKYRVLRRIGAGGLAEVYLAQAIGEASFQRRVALKMLRPGTNNPVILEHFLDEARLASHVSHPNIAQIYDLGLDDGRYFIAMEYVDGPDLEVLLSELRQRREPIPIRIALTVGIQICEGLHAAHTARDNEGRPIGLVHRDVKPSNVLIGNNGSVKLTDFGIAKANERYHGTEVGVVKGTILYMSPEQRVGGPVDARTDLYSAGAVLYEMCTGTQVNLDFTRLAHLDRAGWPHLPAATQLRPDLPGELDRIIFTALKYDPADRYPTARDLAKELEQVLVRLGMTASTATVADWLAGRRQSHLPVGEGQGEGLA